MSDTHVWLRNPDTNGVWACPAALVDMYLGRGWEHSDPSADLHRELYDDPNDPRVGVAAAVEPEVVEVDSDPDQPHAFVSEDGGPFCDVCAEEAELTIHDVPDDPGNDINPLTPEEQ